MTAGPWRSSVAAALPGWLAARALVGAGWLTADLAVEQFGLEPTEQLRQGWFLWDGAFYRDIATDGYGGAADEALRFFPLFPLLGRVLGTVLLGHHGLALVVLANLAALAAGVLLHRLVEETTGDAGLARRSAWLLALFPGAFVLALPYAEALFVAAVLAALLAVHRGQWWWAAAFAFAAGTCRPVGVLLVLPIAAAVVLGRRSSPGTHRIAWRHVVAVAAPGAGIAAVLAHSAAIGRGWLDPMQIQEPLRGDAVFPLWRVVTALVDLTGPERTGDGLHAPFAVVLVGLCVLTWLRLPRAWALFAIAVTAVALAAENLNSLERYALSAFPLVVALAWVTRDGARRGITDAVLGGGVLAFTTLAYLGVYVP